MSFPSPNDRMRIQGAIVGISFLAASLFAVGCGTPKWKVDPADASLAPSEASKAVKPVVVKKRTSKLTAKPGPDPQPDPDPTPDPTPDPSATPTVLLTPTPTPELNLSNNPQPSADPTVDPTAAKLSDEVMRERLLDSLIRHSTAPK